MLFIEALDSKIWFQAVETLAGRARRSAVDLEDQLRHAFHLMQMAPLPIREVVNPTCDEACFEEYLASGALESAALALLPPPLKYSVARGDGPVVLATVALPGDDVGNFASSENAGSALLQAWVQSIGALDSRLAVRARKARNDTTDTRIALPRTAASGGSAAH